jgi:ribosome-associated protein
MGAPEVAIIAGEQTPMLRIAPGLAIEDHEVDERFVRASGPGGQHVNKVATAVQLRFDIGRSSLPDDVRIRLRAIAGSRITADDVLIIDAREHRSQTKNREAARARLLQLLHAAAVKPRARRPTKPTRAAREQRLKEKAVRSGRKAGRRNVRGDD